MCDMSKKGNIIRADLLDILTSRMMFLIYKLLFEDIAYLRSV